MAKLVDVGSIGSYFESLYDPRHTRNRKRLMVDIAVCGIICGCDGPTASIAGPRIAPPGWPNISSCPTASPRGTASGACSWP